MSKTKEKRYNGVDYSSTWRIANYEGKTLVVEIDGKNRILRGFDGYTSAAELVKELVLDGAPVRE